MLKYAGIIAVAIALIAGNDVDAANNTKWSKSTYEKHAKMVSMGFDKKLATYIIDTCKSKTKNPNHCVSIAAGIAMAESSGGKNLDKCNNVFGMTGGCYRTTSAAMDEWVGKYSKYWYKTKSMADFYSNSPNRKPITHYCLSEHSSKSKGHCPNGYKHSTVAFNILNKN